MNDSKKEKQKRKLVEAGMMEPEETLVDVLQASYVEHRFFKLGCWKQGWAYFTDQQLIVTTGIFEQNLVIPYRNIRDLRKCSQFLFPMGITVTHENPENGKMVSDKISMMKRNRWIDFMAEKAGIRL